MWVTVLASVLGIVLFGAIIAGFRDYYTRKSMLADHVKAENAWRHYMKSEPHKNM